MRTGLSVPLSCAPAAPATRSVAMQAAAARMERQRRKALLPFLDDELRLLLADAIRDLQLEVFRADAFFEVEGGAALVVAFVRTLAREEGHEFMLADLEIAEIDLVHAALQQRLGFARRVQVVRHFLVVHLDRHRVDVEERADIERYVDGDLRVRGEKQFLLEDEQVLVEIQDLFLEILY